MRVFVYKKQFVIRCIRERSLQLEVSNKNSFDDKFNSRIEVWFKKFRMNLVWRPSGHFPAEKYYICKSSIILEVSS